MVESIAKSKNKDFAVSLITPWVKGNMFVSDDDILKVRMQNTIFFGLIPAGMTKDNSPLSSVSNVYTSKEYKLSNIIIGLLLAIFGVMSLGSSFMTGLILAVIGVLLIGSGIKTTFAY
ncbi:hypothetical protein [Fructobacillus parabroussonetiae]|uniref:hypothetical protein n=1 Tax=Fructobacillus parabroussonetiae TaxID=2713174 RepID=UPI001EE5CDEC|nr:hypothetical protein [Fructobacillus parabroussonetiae]